MIQLLERQIALYDRRNAEQEAQIEAKNFDIANAARRIAAMRNLMEDAKFEIEEMEEFFYKYHLAAALVKYFQPKFGKFNTTSVLFEEDCPTCRKDFIELKLGCGHTFCLKCILTLSEKNSVFNQHNTSGLCPICNQLISNIYGIE